MQEKTPIFDEIFETLQKKPVMKVWVAYRVGGLTDSSGKNRNEILKPSFDILLSSTIPWLSLPSLLLCCLIFHQPVLMFHGFLSSSLSIWMLLAGRSNGGKIFEFRFIGRRFV